MLRKRHECIAHKKHVTELLGNGAASAIRAVSRAIAVGTPLIALLSLSKAIRGVGPLADQCNFYVFIFYVFVV